MAIAADDDFDDFDEADDYEDSQPVSIQIDKKHARDIRRELDRRLELRQLRELLEDDDLNDLD